MRRLDRERTRQRNALTLAAGQLAGIAVGQPIELHQIEQFLDACADRGLVLADGTRLHAQAKGDVFEHRHVAEQRVVLEHESDMALAGAMSQRILRPSIRTSPTSGQSRPAMIRNSVVLPEPDGPSSASNSPCRPSDRHCRALQTRRTS